MTSEAKDTFCVIKTIQVIPLARLHWLPEITSSKYKDNLKDELPFAQDSFTSILSFIENSEIGVFAREALLNDWIPVIS